MRFAALLPFGLCLAIAHGCSSSVDTGSPGNAGATSFAGSQAVAPRAGSGGADFAGAGVPASAGTLSNGGSAGALTSSGGSSGTPTTPGAGSAPVPSGGSASGGTGTANAGSGGQRPASAGNGGRGGSSGNASSAGGSSVAGRPSEPPPVPQPPQIQGGSNAWASRYWDCCKPACGWSGNVRGGGEPMIACSESNQPLSDFDARNACESGGQAYMCWNGAPWAVSDTLALGFVAASGPNYVCGRCFQVQFTGSSHNSSNPSAQSLNGKTMIVQVINNGGVAQDQFDLLIPGGGVGLLNACTRQWGVANASELGAQYGGFLAGCNGDKNCVRQKCQTIFNGKQDLMDGCDWFLNWYNAADNPNLVYKQIACPAAITQRSGLSDPG